MEADTAAASILPAPRWAKVEIMGHKVHYGRIEEVDQFGVKMLRVNVFTDGDEPVATHDYGGASIYGLTPCTEEFARASARDRLRWSSDYGTPLRLPAPAEADVEEGPIDVEEPVEIQEEEPGAEATGGGPIR